MINIVLFQPEIPQNTGNIMRTCVAANMRLHLIEPLGFKIDQKSLKRSGMDYIEALDLEVHRSWETFTSKYQGPYHIVSRYGQKTYSDFTFNNDQDTFLIFGNESTGMPKAILQSHLDYCMRIPMTAKARSLNLANCVALVSYEVLRQLEFPNLSKEEVIKGKDWINQ